jgi:hypothetical protein
VRKLRRNKRLQLKEEKTMKLQRQNVKGRIIRFEQLQDEAPTISLAETNLNRWISACIAEYVRARRAFLNGEIDESEFTTLRSHLRILVWHIRSYADRHWTTRWWLGY